jgi:hypothetical protein
MPSRAVLTSILIVVVFVSYPRAAAHPRAVVIEARDMAYTANYQNDAATLGKAIATLQTLTDTAAVAADAHYYVSWSYWALSAAQLQRKDVSGAMDSARKSVAHARQAVAARPDDAECQAQLANALIVEAILDRPRFKEIAPELAAVRKKAIALAPNNPRVVLMDAGMIFNNPADVGGGHERGLSRWREAVALFEAEAAVTGADPIAPRWGHALAYGWLANLYLTVTPPQLAAARAAAETALRMRPDFWYVRDQVIPRLP